MKLKYFINFLEGVAIGTLPNLQLLLTGEPEYFACRKWMQILGPCVLLDCKSYPGMQSLEGIMIVGSFVLFLVVILSAVLSDMVKLPCRRREQSAFCLGVLWSVIGFYFLEASNI